MSISLVGPLAPPPIHSPSKRSSSGSGASFFSASGDANGGGDQEQAYASEPTGKLSGPWSKLQSMIDEIGALSPGNDAAGGSPRIRELAGGCFGADDASSNDAEKLASEGGMATANPSPRPEETAAAPPTPLPSSLISALGNEFGDDVDEFDGCNATGDDDGGGGGGEDGGDEEGSSCSAGGSGGSAAIGRRSGNGRWSRAAGVVVDASVGLRRRIRDSEKAQQLAEKTQRGWEITKEKAAPAAGAVAGVAAAAAGAAAGVAAVAARASVHAAGRAAGVAAAAADGARGRVSAVLGASAKTFEQFVAEHTRDEFRETLRSDCMTDLDIPRGSEHSLPYTVAAGASVCWEFRIKDRDIGFALRVREQGEGGAYERDLIPMRRYPAGDKYQGQWTVDGEGDRQIMLVWDNTYSKLRGKMLAYRSQVLKPGHSVYVSPSNSSSATADAAVVSAGTEKWQQQQQLPPALQPPSPKSHEGLSSCSPPPPPLPAAAAGQDDNGSAAAGTEHEDADDDVTVAAVGSPPRTASATIQLGDL